VHPVAQPKAVQPGALAGQHGPRATIEIDPHRVGSVHTTYSPTRDGEPDPGEIVWTWVPYEENDGRGKDRPVIIVAREKSGAVLAVQLTSKDHTGEAKFVELGTGPWDREGRASWANIDRVFRVWPVGMRREAAALDALRYQRVQAAVIRRYGWS
jgi:hypothetical protein